MSMKNFLKSLLRKNNWLIVAIFLIAAGVRFYNFPNRITFWTEQARSLIVAGNYIREKPSLLGQEYFRQDSNAHIIFSGAFFNYSLVPLLLVFNYNPVPITGFFAVLNLLTGVVIFWTVKKMLGEKMAAISVLLFLFNDYMIYHSLFIWNYNYLPLIGILIFYLSHKFLLHGGKWNIFLVGFLSGIGISFQVLFLPVALTVLLVNIWRSKEKITDVFLFVLGLFIGNLPMFIFDVRHDFYQIKTLFQYFLDTLHGKSNAGFAYYYLLPFWPVFSVAGAWILMRLNRINKYISISLMLIYMLINLSTSKISWNGPTGMPKGLTVGNIALASSKISDDSKGDFNVAEVLDFDKRAYVLRYYLQFRNNKNPQGVTDYPDASLLYVLSEKDYNFVKSDVWEVKSAALTKISKLDDVENGYAIYKLEK
jgi:hypothetical protein